MVFTHVLGGVERPADQVVVRGARLPRRRYRLSQPRRQGARGRLRPAKSPYSPYGMKARSSGSGGTIGTSKNGAPRSRVTVPSEAKNTAICCCPASANPATAGTLILVRNVCGFFGVAG